MLLQCHNISKSFGAKRAVDHVNLTIEEHDVFGLLGPNGAGKSTLIKLMTGLIWPTGGSVTVQGYDVHNEHTLAMQNVGAIIEWPSFIPYLTARQNLHILSGGHGPEFEKKLEDVVNFVNMRPNLDKPIHCFSTGMKQRMGIALSLLPNSHFVILDEPANGLDPNGILEIRSIIKERNREFGTTIMLSSHLLNEVEQICTKIAIIHNGQIIVAGDLNTLLQNQGVIHIQATPFDKAVQELKAMVQDDHLPVSAVRAEAPKICLNVTADCAAEINTLLVNRGCAVRYLSYSRKSLSDYFAEMTEGKTDVA